jgi:small redox-active disulfide protein 2
MSQDEVTRIRINKQSIGIVGLKLVMQELAEEYADRPDATVRAELVKRISEKNYIPTPAREDYGKALLREFNKFLGKPYEEDTTGELEIKVLGPGCARCDKLESELMGVLAEMNLSADLDHVRDLKEIAKYGVMGTPALVVNGKVMWVGSVPPREKIVQWLKEL